MAVIKQVLEELARRAAKGDEAAADAMAGFTDYAFKSQGVPVSGQNWAWRIGVSDDQGDLIKKAVYDARGDIPKAIDNLARMEQAGMVREKGLSRLFAEGIAAGKYSDLFADRVSGIGKKAGVAGAVGVAGAGMAPDDAQAGPLGAARRGMRAYHGTPHEFPPVRELEMPDGARVYQHMKDPVPEGAQVIAEHPLGRFDMSKIGTGEGAQVYGHGLYFAENEGVAKGYRQRSGVQSGFGNYAITDSVARNIRKRITDADEGGDWLAAGAIDELLTGDFSPDQIRRTLQEDLEANGLDPAATLKLFDDAVQEAGSFKGSMYEVNIDATPDEFLNYDKPINQQSEYVRAALERAGINSESSAKAGPMALEQESLLLSQGIKGIKYLDEGSRTAGKGTSNYVVFDDKIISIAKKYGISIPLATAVAAGTMTPEQAQAGPLSAGARRIIDPRFSQPVGTGTERKAVRGALETMQTDIDPRLMNIGSPQALSDYEGYPYILTQSDRSAAGGVLQGIHGQAIDPVNLRGSRDFMFDPESAGMVWASDPAVVKNLAKRAAALRKDFGKDPLLLPYSMAPTGIDFATMPLDAMINYARQGMSKANIKKLDNQIKKIIPQWKGVMDPKANAIFRDVVGNKRKLVANIIDKNFREVPGGLSMGEARAATSDAAQYTAPDGGLRNIGTIDTSKAPIIDSGHPTYLGGLPGTGVGTLKEDLSVRPFMEEQGRELTGGPEDIRSLSMNPAFSQGVINESLLRRIYDTQGPRLEEIATKFGVSIPVAAMALMGAPEEASASPLSAAGRAAQKGFTKDVYHGTTQDFDQVDPYAVDLGIHVGTPEQAANRLRDTTGNRFSGSYNEGANIMPLKARMNKTLEMEDAGDWKDAYQVLVNLRNTPVGRKNNAQIQEMEQYADEVMEQYANGDEDWRDSPENRELLDEINKMLADSGYDSIRYKNQVENTYGSSAGLTPAAEQRKAAISKEINALDRKLYARKPDMPAMDDPDLAAKMDAFLSFDASKERAPADAARRQQLLDENRAISEDPANQADTNSYIILDPDANLRSRNAQFMDERGNLLASVGTGLGVGVGAAFAPQEAQASAPQDPQAQANQYPSLGGMGVRMPAPTGNEIPWAPEPAAPAPTGGDLMQQANDDFLSGVTGYFGNQSGGFFNPETYDAIANTARGTFNTLAGGLGDMEEALVGGIMQGIGGVTTWQDALKMLGGGIGQGVISAPAGAGSRFLEGMQNYQGIFPTSEQINAEPGIVPNMSGMDPEAEQRFRGFGSLFSPF